MLPHTAGTYHHRAGGGVIMIIMVAAMTGMSTVYLRKYKQIRCLYNIYPGGITYGEQLHEQAVCQGSGYRQHGKRTS